MRMIPAPLQNRRWTRQEADDFRMARLLLAATEDRLHECPEGAMVEHHERGRGRTLDPLRFEVPFDLVFGRGMTAAGVSGSQYLVADALGDPLAALVPFAATLRAGVRRVTGLQANTLYPRVETPSASYWLSDENAPITETQPACGAVTAIPHTLAAVVGYTHLARAVQPAIEDVIRRDLAASLGAAIDHAILAGAGGAEPLGLLRTPGVHSETGTSLTWADCLAMEQSCADANGEPSAWIAAPNTRALLKARERASGSGFVWEGDTLGGRPAFATSATESASLACGPWEQIALLVWGDGIEFALDPVTNWATGGLQLRALIRVDVVVGAPQAFSIARAIT